MSAPALLPADGRAAVRSLPRRYAGVLAPYLGADQDAPDPDATRGADGASVTDLVRDTTRTLQLVGEAIRQVAVRDTPLLHPAVTDRSHRQWPQPPGETLAGLLDELTAEAAHVESVCAALHGRDWDRVGTVAGGASGPRQSTETSASGLLAEAVDVAVGNLRRIERLA